MVVEGLVAAGTVGPRGRVAAGAVETAEVSGARSCGVVGVSKVETLSEAGCCAAGATKSRGWPKLAAVQRGRQKSRGLPKPAAVQRGRQKSRGLPKPDAVQRGRQKSRGWPKRGAAGQRERAAVAGSVDTYEAWLRSATAMAAAVERFWASREVRRASCSLRVRVVSSIPARVVTEVRSRAAIFVHRGRSSRSCSAAAKSSACWSAVVRAWAMPSSTSRRETNLISTCISGSRLSQTGARCRRWRGSP